jgi:hypothetical protein
VKRRYLSNLENSGDFELFKITESASDTAARYAVRGMWGWDWRFQLCPHKITKKILWELYFFD